MGEKVTIMLTVDQSQFFDTVKEVSPDVAIKGVGERIVGSLLTGDVEWRDLLGLGFYGIEATVEKGPTSET